VIVLTHLDEGVLAINPDQIKQVCTRPETTVVMLDGTEYPVSQTVDEVVRLIADSRALVLSLAIGRAPQTPAPETPHRPSRVWNIDEPVDGCWGSSAELADALNEVEFWANR
jgi:flagellar protein FlbD